MENCSCAKKKRYQVLLKFLLSGFGLVKGGFAEEMSPELKDEQEFIGVEQCSNQREQSAESL